MPKALRNLTIAILVRVFNKNQLFWMQSYRPKILSHKMEQKLLNHVFGSFCLLNVGSRSEKIIQQKIK